MDAINTTAPTEANVTQYPDPEFPELANDASAGVKIENGVVTFDNPGALPSGLLEVPGLVTEFRDYVLDQAPNPNPVLATTAGLAFVSHLMGRYWKSFSGLFANMYAVNLCYSGGGKDIQRTIIKRFALNADFAQSVADDIGSGQGIEDALGDTPQLLLAVDEVQSLFSSMGSDDAVGNYKEKSILQMFSSSQSYYQKRLRANEKANEKRDRKADIIVHPYLSIYGTATPVYFYKSIAQRALDNGLVARLMIVEGCDNPCTEARLVCEKIPPEHLRNVAIALLGKAARDIEGGITPDPIPMEITTEAMAFLNGQKRLELRMKNLYQQAESAFGDAIWSRYVEKTIRLAMVYAFSCESVRPIMTLEAVKWAALFVAYTIRRTAFMCQKYIAGSPFLANVNLVVGLLIDMGGKKDWVGHSAVLKKSRLRVKEFDEVVAWLDQVKDLKMRGDKESHNLQYILTPNAQLY